MPFCRGPSHPTTTALTACSCISMPIWHVLAARAFLHSSPNPLGTCHYFNHGSAIAAPIPKPVNQHTKSIKCKQLKAEQWRELKTTSIGTFLSSPVGTHTSPIHSVHSNPKPRVFCAAVERKPCPFIPPYMIHEKI